MAWILSNIAVFIGLCILLFSFGWWFFSEIRYHYRINNIDKITYNKMVKIEQFVFENIENLEGLRKNVEHLEDSMKKLSTDVGELKRILHIIVSEKESAKD